MLVIAMQNATGQPAPAPLPLPDVPDVRVGQGGNAGPGTRVIVNGRDVTSAFSGDPVLAYEAAREQRSVLRGQLEGLEDMRQELRQELRETLTEGTAGPAVAALQARIASVDARIAEVDAQLAQVDANVARLAGIPGAIQPARPDPNEIPDEAVAISIVGIIFVLFPLSIAMARRLWKRSNVGVVQMPPEWHERMHRLEQAVDTVAVEVERVTEGQRFMTRVITERGLGPGAAQPVEVASREPSRVPRVEG